MQKDASTLSNRREPNKARESHTVEDLQRWLQDSPVNLHLLQICLFSVCKSQWQYMHYYCILPVLPFILINTCIPMFIYKTAQMPLVSPLPPLSRLLKTSVCRFLYQCPLQRATLFNFWSEERTGGKKPLPVLHLFYFITSLLGKWGQLCRPAICLHFLYKTILEL